MTDALLTLAQQPAIASICESTTALLDQLAWDRTILRDGDVLLTYARRYCGYASAALDGAAMPPNATSEPESSAMGQLSEAGLVVTATADDVWSTMSSSPMQTWALMHTLISSGAGRGVPRVDSEVDDPLHLGLLPEPQVSTQRMADLAQLIVHSSAPGVLVAAIAHAELAATRPFKSGSYLIARATMRMVLRARGLDPRGLACTEAGWHALGRTRYVAALRSYIEGDVTAYMHTVEEGTRAGVTLSRSLSSAPHADSQP